jgi:hypothetical protein
MVTPEDYVGFQTVGALTAFDERPIGNRAVRICDLRRMEGFLVRISMIRMGLALCVATAFEALTHLRTTAGR